MDLKPFDNLTEFNKDNAKVLLNLCFSVSEWSHHNYNDSVLPKINDFNLILTLIFLNNIYFSSTSCSNVGLCH